MQSGCCYEFFELLPLGHMPYAALTPFQTAAKWPFAPPVLQMSAFGGKADMIFWSANVRF
jgi:hypothetical protein